MDSKAQILSTIERMTSAFNAGDVDRVMQAYEPGAVVVGEPGTPVRGEAALRGMFAAFVAAKAHFTFQGHEVIQAGDVALHLTPWNMTGIGPAGEALSAAGLSVAPVPRGTRGTRGSRHSWNSYLRSRSDLHRIGSRTTKRLPGSLHSSSLTSPPSSRARLAAIGRPRP